MQEFKHSSQFNINVYSAGASCDGGFKVGHTNKAETRGVMAWLVDHPTQKDYALLLLDTQGTDAIQKDNQVCSSFIVIIVLLLLLVLLLLIIMTIL